MNRLSGFACGLALGIFLWTAVVPLAVAQQTRTLTIRDGTIFVDGRELSADQIPENLDVEGMTAKYRFVGIQRPVIELGGQLYAVENGLRSVSEEEVNAQKSSVILQEMSKRPSASRSGSPASARAAQKQYLNDVQKANRKL